MVDRSDPTTSRRDVLKSLAGAAGAIGAAPLFAAPALSQSKSEVAEVVLAPQFGLSYLPLHVMRQERLIEKHLAKNGLPNTEVVWAQTSGGAGANEGLLSGNIHVVSGGVAPLLTLWDKTRGNRDVKGIGSFDSTSLYLNTINPEVRTIKNFSSRDKIALPAVKVSIHAVTLQMAAERVFGEGQHDVLDKLTVSLPHPDATAALLSGKAEITAHFGAPPFQFQQLEDPRVHRVLSSFEVLGGPTTFNSAYTSARFRNENPRTYSAVFNALVEAHEFIEKHRADAIRIYIETERSKLAPGFIAKIMASPDVRHTIVPQNTIRYAEFMHKVGSLRNRAESFKDYYFPDVHGMRGS